MNCRGAGTRKRIVNEFKVDPVAHIKLLCNQTKHSDAGATIEDEMSIIFSLQSASMMEKKK